MKQDDNESHQSNVRMALRIDDVLNQAEEELSRASKKQGKKRRTKKKTDADM